MLEKLKNIKKEHFRIILSAFIMTNSLALLILTIVLNALKADLYKPIVIYLSIISFIFAILNIYYCLAREKNSYAWFAIILIEFPIFAFLGVSLNTSTEAMYLLSYLISTFIIVLSSVGIVVFAYKIFGKKITSFVYKILLVGAGLLLIFGILLTIFNDQYFQDVFAILLITLFSISLALSTLFFVGFMIIKSKALPKFVDIKEQNDVEENKEELTNNSSEDFVEIKDENIKDVEVSNDTKSTDKIGD